MPRPPAHINDDASALRELLHAQAAVAAVLDAARRSSLELDNVYVVGGVVRDLVIGQPVFDLDLAVEGDGQRFADRLAAALGGRSVHFRGFGTAAVIVDRRTAGGGQPPPGTVDDTLRIDIASTRSETYARPGALPQVRPAPLADDLRRRDFTINAMALELGGDHSGEIVDPFAGIDDLRRGLVRVLHDRSFEDDPTRMFRAARYAGRYHFRLEPQTRQLLESALQAGALETVSSGRLRDELLLLLEEPATRSVELLGELGLAVALHRRLRTDPQTLVHVQAVDHAMGNDPERQVLAWRMRLALLVRDFPTDELKSWLRHMQCAVRDIDAVVDKVRVLDLVETQAGAIAASGPRDLHRLFGRCNDEAIELALLVAPTSGVRAALLRFRHHVAPVRLSVTGHDLLALGIPRGPAVGAVLEELYDRKLAGEVRDDQHERELAGELVRRRLEAATP